MVLCTFSPARAWRPAVVTRLARTLGIRKATVQCSSRKRACRRELSSHEAAKPQMPARRQAVVRGTQAAHGNQQPDFSQGRRERRPVQTHEDAAIGGEMTQQRASSRQVSAKESKRLSAETNARERKQAVEVRDPVWWSALQGAKRHAKSSAGTADAEYRDCSCRGAEWEAQSLAHRSSSLGQPRTDA